MWDKHVKVASMAGAVYVLITPAQLQRAIEGSLTDVHRILSIPPGLRQSSDLSFVVELLESLQLPELVLAGLSPSTVTKLVRNLSIETIPAGQWVAKQGQPVTSLRVVLSSCTLAVD